MKQAEAPRGMVITLGHPANGLLAVKGDEGWRYVDSGEPVDEEAFRGTWDEYLAGVQDVNIVLRAARHLYEIDYTLDDEYRSFEPEDHERLEAEMARHPELGAMYQ